MRYKYSKFSASPLRWRECPPITTAPEYIRSKGSIIHVNWTNFRFNGFVLLSNIFQHLSRQSCKLGISGFLTGALFYAFHLCHLHSYASTAEIELQFSLTRLHLKVFIKVLLETLFEETKTLAALYVVKWHMEGEHASREKNAPW